MPRPRVDFPQPDSPTRPSVSPRLIANETPSTARTGSPPVPYQTRRLRTSRTGPWSLTVDLPNAHRGDALRTLVLGDLGRVDGPLADQRVQGVVDALADQREPGDQEHDRQAG